MWEGFSKYTEDFSDRARNTCACCLRWQNGFSSEYIFTSYSSFKPSNNKIKVVKIHGVCFVPSPGQLPCSSGSFSSLLFFLIFLFAKLGYEEMTNVRKTHQGTTDVQTSGKATHCKLLWQLSVTGIWERDLQLTLMLLKWCLKVQKWP